VTAYGTNFVESEALLAITAEDTDEAERVLRGMSAPELWALSQAAGELHGMAQAMARIKTREVPS
jgi:hypothetical protein